MAITQQMLQNLINGNISTDIDTTTAKLLSTKTNGIEGLPYQFPESVDRRISNTNIGRKYAEKIFGRLPLLFLTPCEPLFMGESSKEDKNIVEQALLGLADAAVTKFVTKDNVKYYTTDFAYNEYYNYLNTMLSAVASYLGIYDTYITIPGYKNGLGSETQKIGKVQWQYELNPSFKTFFSAQENLIFYLDSFDSVSESFSNDTSESSLASQINGYSDQVNEIRFLLGSEKGLGELVEKTNASQATENITSGLGSIIGSVGGGIVGSLSNKGVRDVLEGAKIIFPEVWSNSDYNKSFNLEFKLRSPDNDNLSIFLNIIKPYCKLLALTLPRQPQNGDINAFARPFLVKAYSKGMFNIDMGIITSLTVNKGGTAQWNDDGLPTQMDISIEVKDLYSKFAMSKYNLLSMDLINNTSYLDFLANMAGLNIGQMQMARKIRMYYYMSRTTLPRVEGEVFTRLDNSITRLAGKLYNLS